MSPAPAIIYGVGIMLFASVAAVAFGCLAADLWFKRGKIIAALRRRPFFNGDEQWRVTP